MVVGGGGAGGGGGGGGLGSVWHCREDANMYTPFTQHNIMNLD